MWPAVVAALAVALCSIGAARAECLDIPDVLHRVEATAQSLIDGPAQADWEVIAPPAGIDPKMALAPPQSGILRMIPPPPASGR